MSTLLFEIGCEELPAKVCESIYRQLVGDGGAEGVVRRLLAEHRLLPDPFNGSQLRVLVSPRRVAVLVDGVPDMQMARVQQARGPRVDAAFDHDGVPTKAGLGFARSRGVAPEDLQRVVVDGTELVVVQVEAERRPAVEVVPAFATALLVAIQVPRGMRWGAKPPTADDYLRFSRPIRWLVCKLDDRTVPFPFYDMLAGDVSCGHRVLGASVTIPAAGRYEALLEEQCVVVDQEKRRRMIVDGLDNAARQVGGDWFDPGEVLEEAVYLVEWPTVQHGAFGHSKLRLPADVLVTAMQSHQRYFPVHSAQGDLLPAFLYVSNADPAHAALITRGNERVLEGRLDDAEFAYDRDIAEGLPVMAERLASVVFHAKLGTLADKSERLGALAHWLVDRSDGDKLSATLVQAAHLAKADLVSQVVIEFPTLQGVMGGVYATAAALPSQVAAAVAEQYLPLSATAPLPATLAGGLLAVADKIDNIAGAWIAKEKPSGSRDPLGLRRAAMGIVRIALQYALRLPVEGLIGEALRGYAAQGLAFDAATVTAEAKAFIWERLEGLLLDEGLDFEIVAAALGSSAADIPGTAARTRAFSALTGRDFFTDAVVAYNRCASLAAKATSVGAAVSPALFQVEVEGLLHATCAEVAAPLRDALDNLEIESALLAAARLRPVVDKYFDDVLVMDGDPAVRANRLAQLAAITALLREIGEFARIPV